MLKANSSVTAKPKTLVVSADGAPLRSAIGLNRRCQLDGGPASTPAVRLQGGGLPSPRANGRSHHSTGGFQPLGSL